MKTIKIWLAVNKNGNVVLFSDKPTKNESTGHWESKKIFCNSILQKQFVDMAKKVNMTWNNDPEYFEMQFE